jgi:solute:Na+ symporter, SSS family
MNITALLYFLFFNVLVFFISWRRIRKEKITTSEDYFLGKRSMGFVLVGSMLLLSNINAAQFIGENESVYLNNMSVMAWGVTSVVAMIIVAEFFMPIYLRGGFITIPDFLEARYDTSTKKFVSLIFLISYLFNMLPAVLYSGAVAFNGLFDFSEVLGISNWAMLWILTSIIGFVGILYTILGGVKIVAVSDVLLGTCLFIIGISLPYFGLKYLGQGHFTEGVHIILSSKTEHFNAIGLETDAVPFSTLFTGMLLVNLYYWGMEQFMIQRVLASKNLAESQKGITLAAVGKIFYPLMFNMVGIIAVHLYPKMNNTAEIFSRLAGDVLPAILVGLVAAVIFGAAITAFNAGLNSISTLFVLNIYKPLKEKRQGVLSENELIKTGKKVQTLAAFLGMTLAPFIAFAKGGFYTYLQMVGGAFSVPIFTIIFIGFVTKKVPPIAAKIGLMFFVLSYLLTQTIVHTGLHYLHILAVLSLFTAILMLLIGKFYPMKIPYQPINKKIIDVNPWKSRYFYYILLVILMVSMYILFSPLGLYRPVRG